MAADNREKSERKVIDLEEDHRDPFRHRKAKSQVASQEIICPVCSSACDQVKCKVVCPRCNTLIYNCSEF